MTAPAPTGDLREQVAEALEPVTLACGPTEVPVLDRPAAVVFSPAAFDALVDAVLPVVEAETAALWDQIHRDQHDAMAATQRAEEAEARLAALMDEQGAEQIDRIQAERDAMPRDERARLDAADAPMLRIQLAGMARKLAEVKAELDRTSTAAAQEICHKIGFDTILMWKRRAEAAERDAEHWATEHAVLEYAGCNARHADWCARCRIEAAERRAEQAERERAEALAALPDLIRVAAHVSRGRSFANVEPYPDALARQALGALNDATICAALDHPKADLREVIADMEAEGGKPTPEDRRWADTAVGTDLPSVAEEEPGATIDWEGIVRQRERELKRVGEARHQAEAAVQRVRALCSRGPGPANEYQIWIADVLAALDGEQPEENSLPVDMWTVSVEVPLRLPVEMRHDLFTAVANAVGDWEPDDRDGWDAEVSGSPTADSLRAWEALATVRRVRDLHRPHDCAQHADRCYVPTPCVNAQYCSCGAVYPCPTIAALARPEGSP